MKLNKYFLIGAMGLGLFACSDELDGNGQNGSLPQEGTTYAAVMLKFGNGDVARNVEGDYNDNDTHPQVKTKEEAVKRLQIIVLSGNTVEVRQVYLPNGGENDTDTSDDIATDNKYIIKMQPGEKTFYAVVNAETDFTGTTETELNKYLTDAVTNKKTSDLTADATGFMMTSVKQVDQTIVADVDKNSAPEKNPVKIEVDRVVAKVTVKKSETVSTPLNNMTLGKVEFALGNADLDATVIPNTATAKSGFFRMQKNDYMTPYSNFIPVSTDVHTVPDNNAYKNIVTSVSGVEGVTDGDYPTPLYCLENVHTAGNYWQKNTTYAAIRAEILCTKVVEITVTGEDDAMAWTGNVTDVSPAPTSIKPFYYIYAPETLRGHLILKETLEAETLKTSLGLDTSATITDVLEKLKSLNSDFSISEEYDGHGYYEVWPNLSGTGDNAVSPIYRNNWYELTITKLTLPGKPAIDIEDEHLLPPTNAEVQVVLRAWNKVEHNVELQ